MRLLWTAVLFQLRLTLRRPDTIQVCLTAPLLTVIFMAISEHAGRGNFTAYAVVAPTLMSVWQMALFAAGYVITEERNQGTLEGLVATPAPLALLIAGRLTAVTVLSLFAFGEAILVAGLGFGRWVTISHPLVFGLCLAVTALAMAATASVLSPLFVLVPSARILQNTLSYPFYLLGGVLVPVSALPVFLHPVSRVIFLSWSADLMRDSLAPDPVRWFAARLAVVLVLAVLGYFVGVVLLDRVLRRVRLTGTLSQM